MVREATSFASLGWEAGCLHLWYSFLLGKYSRGDKGDLSTGVSMAPHLCISPWQCRFKFLSST